jgi:hypothetical protein
MYYRNIYISYRYVLRTRAARHLTRLNSIVVSERLYECYGVGVSWFNDPTRNIKITGLIRYKITDGRHFQENLACSNVTSDLIRYKLLSSVFKNNYLFWFFYFKLLFLYIFILFWYSNIKKKLKVKKYYFYIFKK